MKTLANLEDREEILRRMSAIRFDSPRGWGKMTLAEMICHLTDAFCISMGERQTRPIGNWAHRVLLKPLALWVPRKWPHGFPTVAECDARRSGTPPVELAADMALLRAAFERFTRRPRDYALQAHPIFGAMTEREWMRWGYLHTDHHLRQFGA
jgi:Protein of unknown function (DUF1569)